MSEKELQLEDTVSADRKERIIYVGPGKTRKISSITSRQNFNNEKFTRKANKGDQEEDEQEEVKEGYYKRLATDKEEDARLAKQKTTKSNSPQIEFVTGTATPNGSSSTAIGNQQNMGIKKISEALVAKAAKKVKGEEDIPFDGPYTKSQDNVTDKSGAVHTPMSRVRHLARQALSKQAGGVKEEVEQLEELSKSTLKSYVKANKEDTVQRASSDSFASGKAGDAYNKADETHKDKVREKGLDTALNKLTKEETEVVEEGVLGAVAGAVLGGLTAGPVGAIAGGYLGHKTQQAGNTKDELKKRKVKKEETEMSKTYKEFLDQLLEYTPGPGGVTRVQGRSYGAQYHDPEGDDDADDKAPAAKPADAPKRGRGRPKGATSGANHKVTSGKKTGGVDYTGFKLHLPNSNR